ncbi:MAG: hypothetical protein AB1792_10060 [Candidatus Zixiibacteriota bacterium]
MKLEAAIAGFARQQAADGRSGHTRAAYRRDLGALGRWLDGSIDLPGVSAALSEFDALWYVLVPTEREHLIRSIIEHIECSADDFIRVVFRTAIANNQPDSCSLPEQEGADAIPPNAAICV